jgi:hypothetical protein
VLPDALILRMRALPLNRARQLCPVCPGDIGTHIIAAWLSLTRVYLEFECPFCGWSTATCFDLLKVDEWLHASEDDPPPDGMRRTVGEWDPSDS